MCQASRTPSGEAALFDTTSNATRAQPPDDRDGSVRASDAEREAAAEALRVHAAAGRLDVEELDARTGAVLLARTRSDIAAALEDLPAVGPRAAVAPPRHSAGEGRAYAAVVLLLLAIWLLTGAGHFWPLYPAIGWGLPLLLGRSRWTPPRVTATP